MGAWMVKTEGPMVKEFSSTSPHNQDAKRHLFIRVVWLGSFFFSLLALVLSIFCWQQFYSLSEQSRTFLRADQQTFTHLKEDLGNFQTDTKNRLEDLQTLIAQLQSAQPRENAYDVAVFSLIRWANLVLNLEHNVGYAKQLLQDAQLQLAHRTGPRWADLRNALSKDIDTLSSIPDVNVFDVSQRITRVSELLLNAPPEQFQVIPGQPIATMQESSTVWGRVKQWWRSVFVVKGTKQTVVPLLSQQQVLFFKENILLELLQAKWAILNRMPEGYDSSLKNAINALQPYSGQEKIDALIKELKKLDEMNISWPTVKLQSLMVVDTFEKNPPANDNAVSLPKTNNGTAT